MSRLGHEGLLRKVVAGDWGRVRRPFKLALDEKSMATICRASSRSSSAISPAARRAHFSKIGLHTFVDPRHEGGRINKITTRDIVKLVEFEGEEWLFYKVAPVTSPSSAA